MSSLNLKERLERLNEIEKELNKDYGEDIIVKEGEYKVIPRWKLSSPKLNDVLGGGLPVGRIIETFGPESSGKSTLNTQMAVDVQRQGGYIVWIDAEHCFDPEYAKKMGLDINPNSFKLIKPESGEDALDIVIKYTLSGSVDFIVVDSVSALVPKAELEGDMTDNQMGAQARMMGKALRLLVGKAYKHNTSISFINQIRMKIGNPYGNPEVTSGGNALKYYASIRLDIRKKEYLLGNSKDDIIGITSLITAKKNKTASPFRKCMIDIYYNKGIDPLSEYVDFGLTYGVIQKAGNTYYFDDGKIGVGKKQVVDFIRDNEGIYKLIKDKVDFMMDSKKSREMVVGDGIEKDIDADGGDFSGNDGDSGDFDGGDDPDSDIGAGGSGDSAMIQKPRRGRPKKK